MKKANEAERDYKKPRKPMNNRLYNKPTIPQKNYRNKFQSRPNLGRFRYQKRKSRKNFIN